MEWKDLAFPFSCVLAQRKITSEFCEDLAQRRAKRGSVDVVPQHCMSKLLLLWGLALVKQDPSYRWGSVTPSPQRSQLQPDLTHLN